MDEANCNTEALSLLRIDRQDVERMVGAVPGGEASIADFYPLAPLQEGLLQGLLSGSERNCVRSALLEVQAGVQIDALVGALQTVIDRHDALRSVVFWEQFAWPCQVIYRRAPIKVQEMKLRRNRDWLEQLEQSIDGVTQTLDLRQLPTTRLHVEANPNGAQWYALFQVQGLICDATSLDLAISEAMSLLTGCAQELPRPATHRGYVERAHAHARRRDAKAFFDSKLRGIEEATAPFELLDIRADCMRPQEARFAMESALCRRLCDQAVRHNVSLAALLHTAWAVVLARICGRDDVVYGSEVFSRLGVHDGPHRMLGMFTNVLPLRLVLRDVTVVALAAQAQRELTELSGQEQASQFVANRCNGLGSAPQFGAVFSYRDTSINSETEQSGTSIVRVISYRDPMTHPIALTVQNAGEDLILAARTDGRISPQRIIGYWQTAVEALLTALESAPQTPAVALSILSWDERHQILESFNATRTPYPSEKLVHGLFQEQVERTPDAIALVYEEQALTYAELNRRANQLARYLSRRGVGADKVVALCVERSVEMVVGLLAILKAGGAYMPLDPAYPAERLAHMMEGASPGVMLTQEKLRATLPHAHAEVIALDSQLKEVEEYSQHNLPAAELKVTSQHLVYVIYTSGSTGKPKGIAMAHSSMVNLMEWHRSALRPATGGRVLQFAALGFDVAFQEVFSTLCTGGTLVLLNEYTRKNPRALAEFLIGRSIHRLFVPPLVLQSLAECFKTLGTTPVGLLDVITAGEQLRISPEISALFNRLPGCRLHNHYGPTETHVVTALTLPENPNEWPSLPTIGRPISNTQIYVVDAHLQPVPLGVAGEIYIGGVAVARGYLNRSDVTAERFIENPFSHDPPARMYRTGDLGRYREDGTLEYLGRNDHQVKIRGYRIELGEIELRLAAHERVKDAVVIVREDVPGEKRLTAYVTTGDALGATEATPSVEQLRAHLKGTLPQHMIPSAFVILDSLPLTPNGKLDRRALPAPGSDAYASAEYDPPQGEIEESLAGIWRELLGLERVGRDDNFFEVGGHSISGMKLIVKVGETFFVQVPFHAIFQHPTVREMARLVIDLKSEHQQIEWSPLEFEEGVV
jgi:amino acid adenylation domain-containing protein